MRRCKVPGCGKLAMRHPHHWYTRGAHKADAETPDNLINLCQGHHTEVHNTGIYTFSRKYELTERVRAAHQAVKGCEASV